MKKILETERLYLREFETTDARTLFDLNADWDVIKYTGDPPFASEEEALKFIRNYNDYTKNGMGRWATVLKDTHQMIGWCGLKRHSSDMVDVGFRLFKNSWGNGYATEAAKASIDYGFKTLKLSEIVGRVARENTASVKVLNKLGMTFWKEDGCNGIADASYFRIRNSDI